MIEVFRNAAGKWAWHLKAKNGQIIATDGSQGYENQADAVEMSRKIVTGEYAVGGAEFRLITVDRKDEE